VTKVLNQASGSNWAMYQADNVEGLKGIPDNFVHYQITSPPFESLYCYSNSERDMGNSRDSAQFWDHYEFLIKEQLRVTMPGRLVSIHCMNLPVSKERNGYIGIRDFRGEIIRRYCGSEASVLHEAKLILERLGRDTTEIDLAITDASLRSGGFIYHSEVVIWKDPVTAMQRTKALGLLHKQLVKDSCMSRQGIPDYLVTMRKPGENPERVEGHLTDYIGDEQWTTPQDTTRRSIEIWQRYASPVWMDINPSDTLQKESAREQADERHICPLQLQVIRRGIDLWTNPGDLVLDPFMGIGSTGYVALQHGRRTLGFELKSSYFKQAVANLRSVEHAATQEGLFATTTGD
jgi:DNA methylase